MICCLLLVHPQLLRKLRLALGELLERHVRRAAVVLADIVVDNKLDGSVEGHVYQQDEGHIDGFRQDGVQGDEQQVDHEYRHKDRRGLHACAYELVVDMVLVRQERAAVLAYPVQRHSHHVEHRHEQGAEGYDHVEGASFMDIGVEAQVDHQVAEYVAQGKTACVSHEELVAFSLVAEHIVEPEDYHYAESHKSQGGVDELPVQHQHQCQDGKCYAAEPGGESVYPVYEVDGIGDEHHHEQGDRYAGPCRDAGYAEQPGKSVEPVA